LEWLAEEPFHLLDLSLAPDEADALQWRLFRCSTLMRRPTEQSRGECGLVRVRPRVIDVHGAEAALFRRTCVVVQLTAARKESLLATQHGVSGRDTLEEPEESASSVAHAIRVTVPSGVHD
jgi:hypothetical protein